MLHHQNPGPQRHGTSHDHIFGSDYDEVPDMIVPEKEGLAAAGLQSGGREHWRLHTHTEQHSSFCPNGEVAGPGALANATHFLEEDREPSRPAAGLPSGGRDHWRQHTHTEQESSFTLDGEEAEAYYPRNITQQPTTNDYTTESGSYGGTLATVQVAAGVASDAMSATADQATTNDYTTESGSYGGTQATVQVAAGVSSDGMSPTADQATTNDYTTESGSYGGSQATVQAAAGVASDVMSPTADQVCGRYSHRKQEGNPITGEGYDHIEAEEHKGENGLSGVRFYRVEFEEQRN